MQTHIKYFEIQRQTHKYFEIQRFEMSVVSKFNVGGLKGYKVQPSMFQSNFN